MIGEVPETRRRKTEPIYNRRSSPEIVDVWAISDGGPRDVLLRAFGTGRRVPDDAIYRGTAVAADGIVWHVFEVTA